MQQVELTKELLSEELFGDVVFFLYSAPGAMFDAGIIRLITRSGTEYYFNMLEKKLEFSEVAEYFPPLKNFREAPQEWNCWYIGLGTSMVIHSSVYDIYLQLNEEYPNPTRFNWRILVERTLKRI